MYTIFTLVTLAASHAAFALAAPSAEVRAAIHTCVAPKPPANRPQCGSYGSDSFMLKLAHCDHQKTDGRYLIPTENTTTNTAYTYTSTSPPSSNNLYLYPSGFTQGPWAWDAGFGFPGADSSAPAGLSAVAFGGDNSNSYVCQLTDDGVEFQCGVVGDWYVKTKTGQLFSAGSAVKAKGYQKVVPYIFQGCTSSS